MIDFNGSIILSFEDGTSEELCGICESTAGLLLCRYGPCGEDSGTEYLRIIKEFTPGPGNAMTVVFYLESRFRKPLKAEGSIEIPLLSPEETVTDDGITDTLALCGKRFFTEIRENKLIINAEKFTDGGLKGPLTVTTVSFSRSESRRLSIETAAGKMKKMRWKD